MHLSQLLACALLLTLLSLWTSEAKPGVPQKGPRTPLGEVSVLSHAEGGQKKRDKNPGGGGINLRGDRSRLLRDLRLDAKSRWARLLQETPKPRKKNNYKNKGDTGCFGLPLDRIGAHSGLGC